MWRPLPLPEGVYDDDSTNFSSVISSSSSSSSDIVCWDGVPPVDVVALVPVQMISISSAISFSDDSMEEEEVVEAEVENLVVRRAKEEDDLSEVSLSSDEYCYSYQYDEEENEEEEASMYFTDQEEATEVMVRVSTEEYFSLEEDGGGEVTMDVDSLA